MRKNSLVSYAVSSQGNIPGAQVGLVTSQCIGLVCDLEAKAMAANLKREDYYFLWHFDLAKIKDHIDVIPIVQLCRKATRTEVMGPKHFFRVVKGIRTEYDLEPLRTFYPECVGRWTLGTSHLTWLVPKSKVPATLADIVDVIIAEMAIAAINV